MERIEQIDLFNLPQEPIRLESVTEFITDLTLDQIELHKYLKEYSATHKKEPSTEEKLIALDHIYRYFDEKERKPNTPLSDLSCRRRLSKDMEALAFSTTTHHLYTGNGYSRSELESKIRIKKLESEGKQAFKKMTICKMKSELNNQGYYDFNSKRYKHYKSILDNYDNEINSIKEEISSLETLLNNDLEVMS